VYIAINLNSASLCVFGIAPATKGSAKTFSEWRLLIGSEKNVFRGGTVL
jgi:hypothetical protein